MALKFPLIFSSSFFRGSFIYLLGSMANGALPLAAMPILTRYLLPYDYGVMRTATVLQQIFVVLIGLNAYGLIARTHYDRDASAMRRLVSTSFWLSMLATLTLLGLLWPLGAALGRFAEFPAEWLPALAIVSVAAVVQANYLALLQSRAEPVRYSLIQLAGGVLNLGLAIWLVAGCGMDWHGRMWALLISALGVALLCVAGLTFRLRLLRPSFDRAALRGLLAFGVPLIPHTLGGWVMTMAAGLFLNNMASVAETGLFGIAFNLASPIALVVGAANKAYLPALFERLSRNEPSGHLRLCRWLLLSVFSLPVLALIYGLSAKWFLPLLAHRPAFHAAAPFVVWLSLAFAIQGIYFIFGNFVVYSKKTSIMAWRADFLGGITLLIACPLLIRLHGPIGAAQATCLGFTVSMLGCFSASRIAHPMPWGAAFRSFFPARSASSRP